jgi:branched-chain amino acid transport system substrate-binding protein
MLKRSLVIGGAALMLIVSTVVPIRAEDPFEIPVLLSTTGNFAASGSMTTATLHAVEAIVNRTGGIRGRPLHFAIADVQSNPVVAVQLATPLIAKNTPVILGPDFAGSTLAGMPLLKSNTTVLYSFSPAIHPESGAYVFSCLVSTHDLIAAGVRYLREHGLRRIAVLSSTDATGIDQLDQVEQAVALPENRDVTIVSRERFAITDVSVAAQLAHIKTTGANVLFVGTTGPGFGTVLRGVTDNGLDVPVMTNAGNINRPQMEQYISFMPKEVLFTGTRFMAREITQAGPVRNAQTQFYTALRDQGVAKPDFTTNLGWDAAWIVVSGYRKFGTAMTAQQFHDYIEHLHDFAGINGMLDFRDGSQRGLGINATVIVRWDNARHDWIPVSQPGGAMLRS